jgi:hypothetical protein
VGTTATTRFFGTSVRGHENRCQPTAISDSTPVCVEVWGEQLFPGHFGRPRKSGCCANSWNRNPIS